MLVPPSGEFSKQYRFCERVCSVKAFLDINSRSSCNSSNVFHRKNVVIVDRWGNYSYCSNKCFCQCWECQVDLLLQGTGISPSVQTEGNAPLRNLPPHTHWRKGHFVPFWTMESKKSRMGCIPDICHFFLHGQSFWRIKFTPKNANFLRYICKKKTPIFGVKSVKNANFSR